VILSQRGKSDKGLGLFEWRASCTLLSMRIVRIAFTLLKLLLGAALVGALAGIPVALAAKSPPAPPVQVDLLPRGTWQSLDAAQAKANLALLLAGAKPAPAPAVPGLAQARFRRASQEYWVVWSAKAQPVLVDGLAGRRAWLYALDAPALTAASGDELLVSSDGQAVLPLKDAPALLLTEPASPVERFRLQTLWQAETWLDGRKSQARAWLQEQSEAGGDLLADWGRELKGMFFNWVVEKLRGVLG
jgi:hypothetical protein